jgi:hypothetical protein
VGDVTITTRERELIARRLERWPREWRESHFSSLEVDERKIVALLVLDLDARPEFCELLDVVEPVHEQTSLDDPVEPPESMHPRWAEQRGQKPRELPLVVETFMREHGIARR